MARISDDTQAIIDKLVNEGNLLRNSGSHSLKSVKIDIAKFGDVFKSIDLGIGRLNETIGDMVGRAMVEVQTDASRVADIAASFGLSNEYVDLQTRAAEMQIENMDEEARVQREKLQEDARDKEQARKDALKNKPGMVGGLFKKINDKKMDIVKYGLLGYAGFQIIRGALDQFTDGAFSKGLAKVGETISNINWSAIGDGLSSMATWVADNPWLTTLGVGLLGFAGLSALMPGFIIDGISAGVRLLAGGIGSMTVPAGAGAAIFGGSIGLGLGGILLGAIYLLLPMLGKAIQKHVLGYTDADFANAKVDPGLMEMGGSVLQGMAAGATLGMMFGPVGWLAGMIMGGVGALLWQAGKWVEREFINTEETMTRKASGAVAKLGETLEKRAQAEKDLTASGAFTPEQIEAKLNKDYGTIEDLQIQQVLAEVDLFNKNKINIAENEKRLADLKASSLLNEMELNNGWKLENQSVDFINKRTAQRNKDIAELQAKIADGRAADAELTGTVTADDIKLYELGEQRKANAAGLFDRITMSDDAIAKREADSAAIAEAMSNQITVINNIVDSSVNNSGNQTQVNAKGGDSSTTAAAGPAGGVLLPTG
jgi:hypothetical protein